MTDPATFRLRCISRATGEISHSDGFGAIPDAELCIVPGSSHLVILDKPEMVNGLILDFLTATTSATDEPHRVRLSVCSGGGW